RTSSAASTSSARISSSAPRPNVRPGDWLPLLSLRTIASIPTDSSAPFASSASITVGYVRITTSSTSSNSEPRLCIARRCDSSDPNSKPVELLAGNRLAVDLDPANVGVAALAVTASRSQIDEADFVDFGQVHLVEQGTLGLHLFDIQL